VAKGRKKVGPATPVTAFDFLCAKTEQIGEKGDAVVAVMRQLIEQHKDMVWKVDAPQIVTCGKLVEGSSDIYNPDSWEYKRVSLIGNERFKIIDAYLGKRAGVIIRCKPLPGIIGLESEVVVVEWALSQSVPLKDGVLRFKSWLSANTQNLDLDGVLAKIQQEEEEREAARIAEELAAHEEVYSGTWGSW